MQIGASGEPAVAVRISTSLIFGEDWTADARWLEHAWPCTAATVPARERLSTDSLSGIASERPPQFAGLMANCPNTNDRDDTEEGTYMHWLDKNGISAMRRQFPADKGCEDVQVLRSVPSREALGVFHAVSTRDGEAEVRDGQSFFVLNPLAIQGDEAIVEIQFADGFWMLATPTDLEKTGLSADHSE